MSGGCSPPDRSPLLVCPGAIPCPCLVFLGCPSMPGRPAAPPARAAGPGITRSSEPKPAFRGPGRPTALGSMPHDGMCAAGRLQPPGCPPRAARMRRDRRRRRHRPRWGPRNSDPRACPCLQDPLAGNPASRRSTGRLFSQPARAAEPDRAWECGPLLPAAAPSSSRRCRHQRVHGRQGRRRGQPAQQQQ